MGKDILRILDEQELPLAELYPLIIKLLEKYHRMDYDMLFSLYNYGVMQGKRAERARNKKRLQLLKSRQVEFHCKDNLFVKTKEEQNIG